jgi:hypothetical protein
MREPSYRSLIFFPIAAYLLALLLVAAFVVHPSRLGWIGLGVAAALASFVAVLAVTLFPRSRVNARRERPRIGDPYRLLVVADAGCSTSVLCDAVLDRAVDRDAEVFVVAPVLASPLHFLVEAESMERADATARLSRTLGALERRSIRVRGMLGTDDPVVAVGDALAEFPAAELLVIAAEDSGRHWLEHGLERAVRDAYGIHVTTLVPHDAALALSRTP